MAKTPVSQLPKAARREFEMARKIVRARYDAAQTHDHNAAHWGQADSLSARAANNPGVRKKLRERSRYEIENNSWLSGIVNTLAHHTIGIGPRLQILHEDEAACQRVQKAFAKWAKAVRFTEKLATLKTSWGESGETFGLLFRNKSLWPIQLDFRLYEPEQVSNPYVQFFDPNVDDGIHLDSNGIPDSYFFLRYHPGDPQFTSVVNQGEWHDAKDVLHYFHQRRPNQFRGIPPLTPSLELAPILRRFTRAALKAAEVAAGHSSVLKTTAAGVEAAGSPADFVAIEFEHGMHTILPEGWDITQFESKHPGTNYEMIVRVILNEIARPLSMPFNIASCNSAGYNYSSGRLDHQTYYKSIEVDQNLIESLILDKILLAWLDEATFVPGLLDGLPSVALLEWQWCWDAQPVIDESTDARASTERIQSGQSTLPLEWQRRGYGDPHSQLQKGAEAIGATLEQYQQLWQYKNFGITVAQLAAMSPADPVAGVPVAADGGADVQATALNGAQIAGILSITTQVVQGQLPIESAEALIRSSFPLIDSARIVEILDPLRNFHPPVLSDGTPNPALATDPAQATAQNNAPSLGVSTGVRKRDVTNNQKLVRDVLETLRTGGSETLARIDLKRLGLSDDDIQLAIDDARDGTLDQSTLDEIEVPA